jgi:hypothetical protein
MSAERGDPFAAPQLQLDEARLTEHLTANPRVESGPCDDANAWSDPWLTAVPAIVEGLAGEKILSVVGVGGCDTHRVVELGVDLVGDLDGLTQAAVWVEMVADGVRLATATYDRYQPPPLRGDTSSSEAATVALLRGLVEDLNIELAALHSALFGSNALAETLREKLTATIACHATPKGMVTRSAVPSLVDELVELTTSLVEASYADGFTAARDRAFK